MAKFNVSTARTRVSGPVQTSTTPTAINHQGGAGFDRDQKSELFILGVSMFVGEGSFYESGDDRTKRFVELARSLGVSDPEWMVGFVGWLRTEAQIRTAPMVAAVEMVMARKHRGLHGHSRQVVAAALGRSDEPGEMLAYFTGHYGKKIPQPIKRGIADVLPKLYSQRQVIKRADKGAWKFADVIELVHPRASGENAARTNTLFTHLLDARHHGPVKSIHDSLWTIKYHAHLWDMLPHARLDVLASGSGPEMLRQAGLSWQDMSAWIPGAWTDEMWAAVIPGMSYQELLMNLRNFDKAGLDRATVKLVHQRLTDPEEIKRSRMMPMRFLSAHQATSGSLKWGFALEEALQMSLENIPELRGNTLILVDRSGSMFHANSERSQLTYADTAALFGSALALRCERATLVQYGTSSQEIRYAKGDAVLQMIGKFSDMGGTYTAKAVEQHLRKGNGAHDRVVIITDEQHAANSWYWAGDPYATIPDRIPTYTWNLAGYSHGGAAGTANRHFFGGFSAAAFSVFNLLERGRDAAWPWEYSEVSAA